MGKTLRNWWAGSGSSEGRRDEHKTLLKWHRSAAVQEQKSRWSSAGSGLGPSPALAISVKISTLSSLNSL